MAEYGIFILEKQNISITNGVDLNGESQGDGSHLEDEFITLLNNNWIEVDVTDGNTFFADNDGSQSLDGGQTINGVFHADGRRIEAEYELEVTDGTNTYILIGVNINEEGSSFPSYGTVEGLAFIGEFPPIGVPLEVVSSTEGPGATETPEATYARPPCFTSGTLIDTPHGPRTVESLKAGDLVSTKDAGAQPILWAGATPVSTDDQLNGDAFRPIVVKAHAFGPGKPARDTLFSRQHRILLQDWRMALLFDTPEVLCAAVHLVNGSTVLQRPAGAPLMFHHLLLEKHHILTANGLETESFRPGLSVMAAMPDAARAELIGVFPSLTNGLPPFPAARPIVTAWEASMLHGDRKAA